MDKKVDIIINKIKNLNDNSCDIATRKFTIDGIEIACIFLQSTTSDDKVSNFLGKSITFDIKQKKLNTLENLFNYLKNTISTPNIKIINSYQEMFYFLASGFTCVVVDGYSEGIVIETKNQLDRSVSEIHGEPSLKGPKDSFVENYQINIGLIRKRIKDPNLIFSEMIIGRRTKTKIAISYIKDIANTKKIKKLKQKLNNIDIDGILDSSYIRELLVNEDKSIMPQVILTERPDLVCLSLLNGKLAIVVENTPFVLIIPALFNDFFQSPEDYYAKPIHASFTRILRYLAFIIAIITPGLYIAITTYNIEILPDLLLLSFATGKSKVPFPTFIEVLILVIAFEILKEADTRKPNIIGASISIVGALILGDAAVSAGIISPIVVIIVSLSAVCGMIFSDSDVNNSIRVWKLFFMITASFFGTIGIFLSIVWFIIKLCNTESWGIPISVPIAPFYPLDFKRNILRFTQKKISKRPAYLTKNITRLKERK